MSASRVWPWMVVATAVWLTSPRVWAGQPQDPDPGPPLALFDGKTLSGWTDSSGKPVTQGWKVKNGELIWDGRGGTMFTNLEFGDFILDFEWKIAPGGNSGIKYRVRRYEHGVKNRPGLFGLEYQLFDDASSQSLKPVYSTGALYDLYEPAADKPLRPAGQYNQSRVIVRGNHVEHWLNGQKILEAEIGGDDWHARVEKSKFKPAEGFGENRIGRIMIQDHGGQVAFRSIVLQPLEPVAPATGD